MIDEILNTNHCKRRIIFVSPTERRNGVFMNVIFMDNMTAMVSMPGEYGSGVEKGQ